VISSFLQALIIIDKTTKLKATYRQTCPVRRGVSAASFDATGLGERTGHVCKEMN
jgi:hypothetical protein